MIIKVYKIYCETDDQWERWYLPDDQPEPTTCSVDTNHTVTGGSATLERTIEDIEAAKTEDNILYVKDHPASLAYEMCDRDILIKTSIYDARAQAVIPGAGPQATIAYAATSPGARGNAITVEHTAGDTGVGHENRALNCAVNYNNNAIELSVVYGTNGSGNPIVPTALQVAQMLGSKMLPTDPPFLMYAFPTLLGDGSDLVSITTPTALAGGTSPSLQDIKVNPTTFTKGEWSELQQVGCYKSDGNGGYELCTGTQDALDNAVLSVWRYCAHDQTTGAPTIFELRDGFMIVDPNLVDSYEHQAYAIGAPQIPAALGGSVVQFDAYLQYYKGKELGATSPQAKALDPYGPGGMAAAELRIYVYYPQGSQNTHVLRLVTYRPPGTF